jgi:hypothetical protein
MGAHTHTHTPAAARAAAAAAALCRATHGAGPALLVRVWGWRVGLALLLLLLRRVLLLRVGGRWAEGGRKVHGRCTEGGRKVGERWVEGGSVSPAGEPCGGSSPLACADGGFEPFEFERLGSNPTAGGPCAWISAVMSDDAADAVPLRPCESVAHSTSTTSPHSSLKRGRVESWGRCARRTCECVRGVE